MWSLKCKTKFMITWLRKKYFIIINSKLIMWLKALKMPQEKHLFTIILFFKCRHVFPIMLDFLCFDFKVPQCIIHLWQMWLTLGLKWTLFGLGVLNQPRHECVKSGLCQPSFITKRWVFKKLQMLLSQRYSNDLSYYQVSISHLLTSNWLHVCTPFCSSSVAPQIKNLLLDQLIFYCSIVDFSIFDAVKKKYPGPLQRGSLDVSLFLALRLVNLAF